MVWNDSVSRCRRMDHAMRFLRARRAGGNREQYGEDFSSPNHAGEE